MAVIRSVKLDAAPRRLVHRAAPTAPPKLATGAPPPAAAAAPPTPAAPTMDPAVQRAWQQRMQTELEAARAKAQAEGLAVGREQGLTQVAAEARAQHDAVSKLFAALSQAIEARMADLEEAAIAIAFEATLKLLGDELVREAGVRAAVGQVLQRVHGSGKATVRLAPQDCKVLAGQPEWAVSRFEFKADAAITPGGCIVEVSAGRVDGRLETRLSRLADALLAARTTRDGVR